MRPPTVVGYSLMGSLSNANNLPCKKASVSLMGMSDEALEDALGKGLYDVIPQRPL